MARPRVSVHDNAVVYVAKAKQNLTFSPAPSSTIAEARARQSAKIKELGIALTRAGLVTLDEQARALGLSRSTMWTILKASHKGSGLSAATIDRMLSAPELPVTVSAVILEYAREKARGLYGHNKAQRRRFYSRVGDRKREDQKPEVSIGSGDHHGDLQSIARLSGTAGE